MESGRRWGGQEEGVHKELIRREARGGVDTSLITMSSRIHES